MIPAILQSHHRLLLLAPGLLLCGCQVDPSYPSLAPRPIENISLAEPSQKTPPAGTPDTVAIARYAPIVDRAKAADGDFQRILERNRTAIERGRSARQGDDAWIVAQQALSEVEAARNPVATALGDLDAARNAEAPRTDSGLAAAVTQAYRQVREIDRTEAEALSQLWPGQ